MRGGKPAVAGAAGTGPTRKEGRARAWTGSAASTWPNRLSARQRSCS